jgi:ADP-ribose pyrophosphatase YjhB (NUDIX family)
MNSHDEHISAGHQLHPGYRFCPMCGDSLHEAIINPEEPARLVCASCGFVFFVDPKVVVGTIATLNGRIILQRRAIAPAPGKWALPGGYVDRGERLEEAAVRETLEEVNVEVTIDRLLNAYSYRGTPYILVVYEATVRGGTPRPGHEVLEVATFTPAEIPWNELAFLSTRDALKDYLSRHECEEEMGRPAR